MFNFNETPHAEALDERIAKLLRELENIPGDSAEYTNTTNNVAKLMQLRDQAIKTGNEQIKIENERLKTENADVRDRDKIAIEEDRVRLEQSKITLDRDKLRLDEDKFVADEKKARSWKPSTDALVAGAASIIGILCVLHYEKAGVVTSKALGFVGRGLK
jgi:hypothetical protein